MKVFDIGFYDGQDSSYYLERGFEVVGFEANPQLCRAARETFAAAIGSGRLRLEQVGIGLESGQEIDFFVHSDNCEWSTFYREAAINWGPGKSSVIRVPCITPAAMFERFGIPDYVKCDIEGYDVHVAVELANLDRKPRLASFEASDTRLLHALAVAGYRSFKLVDQARVPLQSVRDPDTGRVFTFRGGTGPFGDDAEGLWLSFENVSYLFHRLVHDPFSSSTPPGHWFDLHASLAPPPASHYEQRDHLKVIVGERYGGHCGMRASPNRPPCPARADIAAELEQVRRELDTYRASRAFRLASVYGRFASSMKRLLGRGRA